MGWMKCTRGTWIGPIEELSASRSCPGCASEVVPTDIDQHWADVEAVERGDYVWPSYKKTAQPEGWMPKRHPYFIVMCRWAISTKRCFNHIVHMRNAYKKETGIFVDIEP